MFGLDLIWLGVTGAAAAYSYFKTRQFVRRKLRFVDAVQNPMVPLAAGFATALVFVPLAALPFITIGTGFFLGLGVGAGVLHGSRDIKRLPSG